VAGTTIAGSEDKKMFVSDLQGQPLSEEALVQILRATARLSGRKATQPVRWPRITHG